MLLSEGEGLVRSVLPGTGLFQEAAAWTTSRGLAEVRRIKEHLVVLLDWF